MLISGPTAVIPTAVPNVSRSEKPPAALINLCAFPAVPQGKRYAMVNRTEC
jgi:hypothetical protein